MFVLTWWFNACEAALWLTLGTAVLLSALLSQPLRAGTLVLSLALLAFGASDIVETQTGAWWRPWWLLAWKAACVVVLGWWVIAWVIRGRRIRADLDRPPRQAAPPAAPPASPAPR